MIKQWLKRAAARLLVVLMACVLIWIVLEMAMRVLSAAESDPMRHDRSSVAFYPSGERLNPWSAGYSDPLRIAAVGDSITHGAGVHFLDTYGMRLEALLNHNEGQRPAKVRVWARGGESTYTELRYLEEVLPWEPDLLILGICLNDTEDPYNMGEVRQWRLDALPPTPSPGLARLLGYTRLGTWVYQQLGHYQARKGYLEYYRKLYEKDYSGWKRFVQSLRRFNEVCREHDITFVPVVFPLFTDVDNDTFDWIHEQVAEVFREEGIAYLDLRDTYRGLSPERLQAIPLIDPHPNEIAHRLAAESIFQFLLANEMIDPGYLPQYASASPDRMWRLLGRFIHDAASVEAEDRKKLMEPDDMPEVDGPEEAPVP